MKIRLNSHEQEELILNNQELIYHVVSKLHIYTDDYNDIISVGKIGLVKAAASFDMSKNIHFSTYAVRCIHNEILLYFRQEYPHTKNISLYSPVGNDKDGDELLLFNILATNGTDFSKVIEDNDITIRCINIILNLFNPRDRLIMLYQIAGVSQQTLSSIFNISRPYVSKLERQLRKKIKSYLNSNKQFKKIFSMTIIDSLYQISFSAKDLKDFNQIWTTSLEKFVTDESSHNFRVIRVNQQVLIQVPAHPESFSFIAHFFQKLDNFG